MVAQRLYQYTHVLILVSKQVMHKLSMDNWRNLDKFWRNCDVA